MTDDQRKYDKDREDAALAKAAASMELKLHGVTRNRDARKRLEAVLGPLQPHKADNGEESGAYDPLRHSRGYDPLRYGLNSRRWGE